MKYYVILLKNAVVKDILSFDCEESQTKSYFHAKYLIQDGMSYYDDVQRLQLVI